MSPLAEAVYEILRLRPGSPDPRFTYAALAGKLRETSEEFETITHRSQQLYAALGEVARVCERLRLPSLAALVVRADSRRPGEAYYQGRNPPLRHKGEKISVWRQELEAASRATYPPSASNGEQAT
jgi:hypothetical protein